MRVNVRVPEVCRRRRRPARRRRRRWAPASGRRAPCVRASCVRSRRPRAPRAAPPSQPPPAPLPPPPAQPPLPLRSSSSPGCARPLRERLRIKQLNSAALLLSRVRGSDSGAAGDRGAGSRGASGPMLFARRGTRDSHYKTYHYITYRTLGMLL